MLALSRVTAGESIHQRRSVDRVNDVGISAHCARLVRLQLPDEVPRKIDQVSALQRLRFRFLVAVLADISDAEVEHVSNKLSGVKLRHNDERDLTRVTPR